MRVLLQRPTFTILAPVSAGSPVANNEVWQALRTGGPAFITKMSLIVVAGLNVVTFHFGVYSTATAWDSGVEAPAAARLQAAGSLPVWISVIAGR